MRPVDTVGLALQALRRFPLRTAMLLLAISIGVAAVVMLTAVAEGARRYVTGEFASLGTHLLVVLPGRSETAGAGVAGLLIGETARDLTLDDVAALERSPRIVRLAPIVLGSGTASQGSRQRDITVVGTNAALLDIEDWTLEAGRFLPPADLDVASPICVIGSALVPELFGTARALGKWLRIGPMRCRVIGVLRSAGLTGPFDTDEMIVLPVASAQQLFNTAGVFRIMIEAASRDAMPRVREEILEILKERHQGEEDVTVITQDAVQSAFDSIFDAITLGLAAIAGISLVVAGILIMNVMLVAVNQRTSEIGLLKALGARNAQITSLFLCEAASLSACGGLLGLGVGAGGTLLLRTLFPTLEFRAPLWASAAAVGVAFASGLLFGILPARHAARLDPVQALTKR